MLAFSDGLFAIAMTLFFISFVVIGRYWIAHHQFFRMLREFDYGTEPLEAAGRRQLHRMKIHVLEREQLLPGPPDAVFPFFAEARNLEAITPPLLRFRVVTPMPIEMRTGTLVQYRLRLHGLPLDWLTRIAEWVPGERFVDEQIAGPYRLWHHTHEFEPAAGGGTLMRDTVRYALPLWPLGELAAPLVRRDLARIFDHRQTACAARLGG